jgi:beta-glucosidase
MSGLEANEELMKDLYAYQTYETSTAGEMPIMGANNGLTLAMMIGKDFDDPMWEDLLDQVTFEEMATLIGKGYHNTALMESISKPATVDDNGPQGFTQTLTGVSTCHCAYSDENIMAATYNVDLMEEVGKCIGNDMLDLGAVGLYGPAMNIHRTAYAGRNFEYYSEDGFLSGAIAAAEVKGIQSKGVYVYIKHFALNDSETNCRCLAVFSNEQAIREVYLKPFQMAVEDGGAHNVMNSFSRVGSVWSGAHKGLMTEVLRNEWGMDGFALTDFSGNSMFSSMGLYLKSFDVAHGLLAGTDSWDSSAAQWTDDLNKLYRNDPTIATAMRNATHRILYTVANSHAMNGFDENTIIKGVTPWWKTALVVLQVIIGLLTIGAYVMLVRKILARKQHKAAPVGTQNSDK